MDKVDIQPDIIIYGIKLKTLSTKKNDYSENNMFQILDEKQLQYIYELAEGDLKMTVWKYNDNCYLNVNEQKKLFNMGSINIMKNKRVKLNELVLNKICHTLWI